MSRVYLRILPRCVSLLEKQRVTMASERMQKIFERDGRNTSSNDPKMMEARVFIGNLPADTITRQEIEKLYKEFGKILGISLHKSYGFVQFDNTDSAEKAVKATHGKMMNGKRLDVNIATERRKEPGPSPSRSGRDRERDSGRRRDRMSTGSRERDRSRERFRGRFRSPSPSRLEYESRMHQWERLGPPGGPYHRPLPPPPPHGRDPYMDHFRDPFYGRPRDDPFDRYPERLPPRDYPPPRRDPYPPPSKWAGDPYDHYARPLSSPEIRGRGPPPPTTLERRPPVERVGEEGVLDMEIIIVNRPQRDYGELVKSRMESIGIRVEIATLSPTVSLADALDSAAQRSLLYCVIITGQHEIHRSVTLTILHGRNPQEHKNMPLDDALGLLDRDFERYLQGVREGRIPPRKPQRDTKSSVSSLLTKAASGEDLDAGQLQSLIDILQEKKQSTAAPRPNEYDFSTHQLAKDDIQRQQADLQAKILSLLGSNAVVPSPTAQSSSPSVPKGPPNGSGGLAGYPSAAYGGAYGAARGGAEGGASGRSYSGLSGYGY